MPRKIIYQEELKKEPKPRQQISRETLKRILAGVFLALMALFGFAVVLRSCIDMAKTPGPAARPAVSSDPAVTRAVSGVLKEHFPGHYSIAEDGEYIRICIWDDELTDLAVKALEGSSYARGQWDGLMGDVSRLRDSIQELYGSRRVILSVCTDKTCQDVLYSVSTSGVIFDGVNQ